MILLEFHNYIEKSVTPSKSYTAIIILSASFVGCSKVEYDPNSLGFVDKAEMEAAFEKGYHTKQMFTEMLPPPDEKKFVSSPRPVQEVQEQSIQDQISQEATVQESEKLAEARSLESSVSNYTHAASICNDVSSCVNAMLASAKVENLAAAMDAARRIDGFHKPERGDRKTARKLNDEALNLLNEGKNLDAINRLMKARENDSFDEEILTNLVFAYAKEGEHNKATSISMEGFNINPRRSSLWLNYSESSAKLGDINMALQAMWLAWQFSPNKENTLKFIDKKIISEQDAYIVDFYKTSRSWLKENKRPAFN